MHFLATAAVVFAALTSTVHGLAAPYPQETSRPPLSGAANPISAPLGDVLVAGKPYTIKWSNDFGKTVTLRLRKGSDSNDLDNVLTIVSNTNNDGEYTWIPPKQLEGANDYAIEIIADGSANYSPKFKIKSNDSSDTPSKTSGASSKSTLSSTKSSSDESASSEPTSTESASGSAEPTSDVTATSNETSAPSSTESTITAPGDNDTPSAAGQLRSPLALVLCIVAGLVYFH